MVSSGRIINPRHKRGYTMTFILGATAFVLAFTLGIQKIMDKKGDNNDS